MSDVDWVTVLFFLMFFLSGIGLGYALGKTSAEIDRDLMAEEYESILRDYEAMVDRATIDLIEAYREMEEGDGS